MPILLQLLGHQKNIILKNSHEKDLLFRSSPLLIVQHKLYSAGEHRSVGLHTNTACTLHVPYIYMFMYLYMMKLE